MRNLKKVLALILSLVMALSLVTVVGATSYSDDDDIGAGYKEAADVMSGLKLFEGSDDSFNPDGEFTRAQLAGILYRVDSKDTAGYGKDKSGNYIVPAFSDVPSDAWYAGYVGYCYVKNLVSGAGDGTYNPNGLVTGYQVLAAMLRLAGYTKSFTGDYWYLDVVSKADELGLLDTVTDANKLSQTATRQGVCDMAFHVLTEVDVVGYTEKDGYTAKKDEDGETYNLGLNKFGLTKEEDLSAGTWGAPSYKWVNAAGDKVGAQDFSVSKTYPYAITEAQLAKDLGLKKDAEFELYVNGKTLVTDKYQINVDDTVTKVGGQGRTTSVYYDKANKVARIVMQDEFLAQVTGVTAAANGLPSKLSLNVYDRGGPHTADLYNGTTNFEYAKGDVLILTGYTVAGTDYTDAKGGTEAQRNARANSEDALASLTFKTDSAGKTGPTVKQNVWIVGKADVVTGKPTAESSTSYTVGGTVYNKQNTLHMGADNGAADQKKEYDWYLGSNGDVLGYKLVDTAVPGSSYGIITAISASLTEEGATAEVLYSTGETGTITIGKFRVAATLSNPDNTNRANNVGKAIDGSTYNVGTLTPLYYAADGDKMLQIGSITSNAANVNISPSAALNAKGSVKLGILGNLKETTGKQGNLFKFVADTTPGKEGQYIAYEVAGTGTATVVTDADQFSKLYNDIAGSSAKLNKEFGYLITTGNTDTIRMDNATKIMVRDYETGTVAVYNGIGELPGDMVVDATDTEIDWVMGSGTTATVVYFTGDVAESAGTLTYGLLYVNSDCAVEQTLNSDGKTYSYTVEGYLNGAAKATYEASQAVYTAVKSATAAQLFAIEVKSGKLNKLMDVSGETDYGLADGTAVTSLYVGGNASNGNQFKGKENNGGNEYTDNTKVYKYTVEAAAGTYTGAAVKLSSSKTYQLNSSSKVVVGDLASLNGTGTYDVTIVFEDKADTIRYAFVEKQASETEEPEEEDNTPDLATIWADLSNPTAVVVYTSAFQLTAQQASEQIIKQLEAAEYTVTMATKSGTPTTWVYTAKKGSGTYTYEFDTSDSDKKQTGAIAIILNGEPAMVKSDGQFAVGSNRYARKSTDNTTWTYSSKATAMTVAAGMYVEDDLVKVSATDTAGGETDLTKVLKDVYKNGTDFYAKAETVVAAATDAEGSGYEANSVYYRYGTYNYGQVDKLDNAGGTADGTATLSIAGAWKVSFLNSDGATWTVKAYVHNETPVDISGVMSGKGTHYYVNTQTAETPKAASDTIAFTADTKILSAVKVTLAKELNTKVKDSAETAATLASSSIVYKVNGTEVAIDSTADVDKYILTGQKVEIVISLGSTGFKAVTTDSLYLKAIDNATVAITAQGEPATTSKAVKKSGAEAIQFTNDVTYTNAIFTYTITAAAANIAPAAAKVGVLAGSA